jgi:light-regulated signal transduction histidine kinase (bacteriophytochrome)
MGNDKRNKRVLEHIEILHTDLALRACEKEIANLELEAFSDAVAHDLRVPLTIINGYCQLILDCVGDNFDEQCKGYFQLICDETERSGQLIDALLRFSRLSHHEILQEKVDLGSMAHEIVYNLMKFYPERRMKYTIEDNVVVKGDANLLRVVMENLLGNAWKYSSKEDETCIEFGTREQNGSFAYFIRDNGVGFDMTRADKLFKPFQRLHAKNEFEGIGIGLHSVRRIIQRHGGQVWAEGDVGIGATFYFTLD